MGLAADVRFSGAKRKLIKRDENDILQIAFRIRYVGGLERSRTNNFFSRH